MLLLASPGYGEITQDKLDTTIEVRDEREDRMMLSYEVRVPSVWLFFEAFTLQYLIRLLALSHESS